MNNLRQAAQQALEALERAVPTGEITLADWMKADTALRAALAEPANDKPRAWIDRWGNYAHPSLEDTVGATPLYTRPAAVAEPVAIHQWRKRWCAEWYDGHPDHSDGGGPYETRTLYAATKETA